MAVDQTWTLNPEWLDEPSWSEVAGWADRLTKPESDQAVEALREIFRPDWADGRTLDHRVAAKQLTYPGRLSLLELGRATAVSGTDQKLAQRLRDRQEFLGASAELRAALLLIESGAELVRSPRGAGSRLSEYVVRWPSSGTSAVVEVKTIQPSDSVSTAGAVTTQIVFSLMKQVTSLPGLAGHVEWNRQLLFRSQPPAHVIDSAVETAITVAKSRVMECGPSCTVPIGEIASLHLTASPSDSRLQLSYDSYAPDSAKIFRRLRRRCNDALQQLATHPKLPGLIFLDVDDDGLARNGFAQLENWASKQSQVGAVIAVEREYSARKAYTHVCVFPGPRFEEVAQVFEAFELCDQGHLHFQPLCGIPGPCPTAFGVCQGWEFQ